jgi:hypothetical protein
MYVCSQEKMTCSTWSCPKNCHMYMLTCVVGVSVALLTQSELQSQNFNMNILTCVVGVSVRDAPAFLTLSYSPHFNLSRSDTIFIKNTDSPRWPSFLPPSLMEAKMSKFVIKKWWCVPPSYSEHHRHALQWSWPKTWHILTYVFVDSVASLGIVR